MGWIAKLAVAGLAFAPAAAVARPVVQLTVAVPESIDDPNGGDTLVRELQRQAVLLTAREELGLGTRDMTLDEPLSPNGDGVVTLLAFTRVDPASGKAVIQLGRADATAPAAAADLPVGDRRVTVRLSVAVAASSGRVPDYPALVAECERATRTVLTRGLTAEHLTGTAAVKPTRWVDVGPLDPAVDRHLGRMDPFTQFWAVRGAHRQIEADGASYDRVDALVRGYANLSVLTRAQWNWADNALAARALLYAQRLVVHEAGSPRSLYTRAYARALVGLHAAALDDLAAADKANGTPPDWVVPIRAACHFDLRTELEASTTGPWACRPLAGMLLGVTATDGYAEPTVEAVIGRVVTAVPGAIFLSTEATNCVPTDLPGCQVPTALRASLREGPVPIEVARQGASLTSGGDRYKILGHVRDGLAAAADGDPGEPSLGVLAGLVEQQAFAAIAKRAQADSPGYSSGDQDPAVQMARDGGPIVDRHPWGWLIARMHRTNTTTPDTEFDGLVAKLKPRDDGWWIDVVNNHVVLSERSQKKLADKWIAPGHRMGARTAYQYEHMLAGGVVWDRALWAAYRAQSPYSANLMSRWLMSVERESWLDEPGLFDRAAVEVAGRFGDRPEVVVVMCDVADRRADYGVTEALLTQLMATAPTGWVYERLARIARHRGRTADALALIDQGMRCAASVPNDSTAGSLNLLRARVFADAGRTDDAIQALNRPEGVQNASYLQMQARCLEAAGADDEAESAMRAAANMDSSLAYQVYYTARRLGRPDADGLYKTAVAVAKATTDDATFPNPKLMIALADGADGAAFTIVKGTNAGGYGLQLERLLLAVKQHDPVTGKAAIDAMKWGNGLGNGLSLSRAVGRVVNGHDLPAALAGFDRFEGDVLNAEELVVLDSFMGRYLMATGHKTEGATYLARALRRPEHDDDAYFLAWLEATRQGLDLTELAK